MARKKVTRPEMLKGGYSGIPWIVLDSQSFMGATDKAKSLLFALMRQHNGHNNGHLHLAKGWLSKQGWTCDESNRKAKRELIERGLIIHTKQGGLNMGADLYALTWHEISNYVGLDIKPKDYRKGAYTLCNLPPTKRRSPPAKKNLQPVNRASASSTIELANQSTGTTTELVKPHFEAFTGSVVEHNVITPLPAAKLVISHSNDGMLIH